MNEPAISVMGKIIAWLVLIFIVLLALRLVNRRKRAGSMRAAAARRPHRGRADGALRPLRRLPAARRSDPTCRWNTPAPTVNA